MSRISLVLLFFAGCVHLRHPPPPDPKPISARAPRMFPLPGAQGELDVEALYFDQAGMRIWVPAGSTGNVDVIEVATGNVQPITGFQVVEPDDARGHPVLGPTSLARGNGVIFVGNRGSSEICTIDPLTLTRGGCTQVPDRPHGMAFVDATRQLWVLDGDRHSVTVFDASNPAQLGVVATLDVGGVPVGAAVDQERGLFYTTLQDTDRALVIDVWQKKIVSNFEAGCGRGGTRGLALDTGRQFALIACESSVSVLDLPHGGLRVAHELAGQDIAHIAYVDGLHRLFVGAGKDARLTEFAVTEEGKLVQTRTSTTARGAKVVVADASGNVFVADPRGRIIEIVAEKH